MLKEGILSLQLNTRGEKNREIVAVKRFTYEDLPGKMKTFTTIMEVFEHFQGADNFEVDPQSATVTVFVYFIRKYVPVKE